MIEAVRQGLRSYGTERFIQCIVSHIEISLITLLICLIIGIPLGILCGKNKYLAKIILSVTNFLKVVPSLAVMIILLPILGAGPQTAAVVLTILGLPPIMVNTCLGIRNIEPKIIEAAEGIGMDKRTILRKIQIPKNYL